MTSDTPISVRFSFTLDADHQVALPSRQTAGSSGYDVRANLLREDRSAGVMIPPGRSALISTGICLALPSGYEATIRPRSGLAAKYSVTVLNTPGTIDSDYRGEVRVLLMNFGSDSYIVKHGDRIAQFCFQKTLDAQFLECSDLGESERGEMGFGSSGHS
jgi:dUTP pyrophosphatase